MPINIYAPTSADNLSLVELDLYHLIMEYRAEQGLPAIPLSGGLTLTAGRHSLDQYHNIEVPGTGLPEGANLHSWSDRPYMSDGSTPGAMTNAPQRLQSGYNDPGYEITAYGQPDVERALAGWKQSPGHDIVIRNAGPWTGISWGAIGIGVEMNERVESGPIRYGNYYNVWFGQAKDPGGPPLIEGTTAADTVRGTAFADRIAAGGGDDTIRGHGGDDRIHLGGGNNAIFGGTGTDTLVVNLPSTAVEVAMAGAAMQITLGPHVSTLHGMELFEFTDGTFELTANGLVEVEQDPLPDGPEEPAEPDGPPPPTEPVRNVNPPSEIVQALPMHSEGGNTGNPGMPPGGEGRRVIGDDADNVIGGPPTDDTLNGGGGDDMISGGDGWDLIAGGDGNDTISGGNGNDMIGGGFGDDKIVAGAGRDTIGAGRGDDSVNGGLEDDVISGGPGDDVIFGEAGDDVIGGSYGDDTVSDGDGNDNLGGGTGMDILAGHDGDDSIGGGEGNDLIGGGNGDDFLAGGGRNDTILGGSGNDTINGGEGNDHMYGQAGADVFVFNGFTDGEVDRIYDFDDGEDVLRLRGISGNNTQERIEALDITYFAFDGEVAGARLTYGGHTIEIAGIAAEDLGVGDFIFI
ncbi:hypothetical protein [Roseivivax sediminis]|uniref:Ca2+-binding protein, RTX toxin-related n=1 Tax=Roseivivax sediminis TaxID=936889 RepID=A0A1I1UN21_9RHOB|nr:hypothetical protein [Roseivivax sediminis]SFD70173.1 Ca2+-binding protein, RTX toxin-related [Roseivivax sediminis]